MKKILIKAVTFPLLLVYLAAGLWFMTLQGCSLFKKHYEKTEVKDFTVNSADKKKLFLDNVNGNVKILKNTSGDNVRIKAEITAYVTKKELDKPLDEFKILIDSTGDKINIRSERIKEKHFFNFSIGNSDRVNYEIYVPSNLEVSVENTNGKLYFEDIENNIKVNQTNGNISVKRITGETKFDITNGKFEGDIDSIKSLKLNIVNGNVTLNLDEKISAKFNVSTVNGKVTKKDLPFTYTEDDKKSFSGTLGKGDAEIKIDVVNGKINLNKK